MAPRIVISPDIDSDPEEPLAVHSKRGSRQEVDPRNILPETSARLRRATEKQALGGESSDRVSLSSTHGLCGPCGSFRGGKSTQPHSSG